MYVLKDRPVLFGIFNTGFIAEGLGIALEVDNISTILLLLKHLGYCCLTPLVRVGLCLLTTSTHTLTLPIGLRHKDLIVLENSCDSLISVPLNTKTEYPPKW